MRGGFPALPCSCVFSILRYFLFRSPKHCNFVNQSLHAFNKLPDICIWITMRSKCSHDHQMRAERYPMGLNNPSGIAIFPRSISNPHQLIDSPRSGSLQQRQLRLRHREPYSLPPRCLLPRHSIIGSELQPKRDR